MLKFQYSMAVAAKLLTAVRKCGGALKGTIEAYSNGREQGYCINVREGPIDNWRSVAFSENRNSDNIVVYYGKGATSFSMQGNVPSDTVYGTRRMFSPGQYAEAAKFIVDFLGEPAKRDKALQDLADDAQKNQLGY